MVRLLLFSYKQVWGQLNKYLFIDWLIYSVLFVYFNKPTRRAWHSSLRTPRSSPLGTFREEKHRFSSRSVPQRRWARRNDCFRRVLTQKYYYEITWLFFRIIISFFYYFTFCYSFFRSEHIHWDNPDAPICPEFILGKCENGSQCTSHHCILPYQWQYLDCNDHEWKNLNEEDNERLEKMYCDVTLEKCLNKGIYKSFERHVKICSCI